MYRKDWIGQWAIHSPEKVAVRQVDKNRQLTYAELNDWAEKISSVFQNQWGISKGDRVAVLAEFCLEYVILFSVAQKLGITLVPLNFRLAARELDYLLSNSNPSAIIVADKYLPLVDEEKTYQAIPHRYQLDHFLEEIDKAFAQQPVRFPTEAIEEDHPLFILYTSGTTGFPKGALYTHKMAVWNSINTQLRLDITAADHTIICMPPFHTGGWNVFLTPFLHHGASVSLLPKFDAEQVMNLLEEEEATLFMAVPTMLKMMAETEAFRQVKLQKLRYFIVGGEAMPIPLIETWHAKGVLIRQGYGMTEVGPNITSLNHQDAIRKKGSIGKANFYVETKLVNEDGKEVGADEVGELLLRGPMVTPGYWQNPEATAKTIKEGWFHTGDVMKQDEEGFLYVMDRIKHMFISGGENVYPAEVEHFLRTHPSISEVAIVGVPDPKWGEVGKAYVVLKDGEIGKAEEVIAYCQGKLAKYKIPKHVEFMNELPKTDTGKIDRKRLA